MFNRPYPQTDLECWFKDAMTDQCPPDNTVYFCNLDETEDTSDHICAECWLNYIRCVSVQGIKYHEVHKPYHPLNGILNKHAPTELFRSIS